MFFKYVYGKIHQYPYFHIITWGLPKRYFGLLRIFNLQLEYQPHLCLKEGLESLAEYESPSTSSLPPTKSTSINLAPNTSKHNYIIKNENFEPAPQLAQATGKGGNSSGRQHRRLRRKPVISIKINLDDDLRNVKSRSYSENLDRILSKSSQKTHLLIIEKTSSSKRDEYHLSIVNNNTIHSHPYSKLLRKNRRKSKIPPLVQNLEGPSLKSTKPERTPSYTFTLENIYPPLNRAQTEYVTSLDSVNKYAPTQSFTKTTINSISDKTNREVNYFSGGIADQMVSLNSSTVFNNETIPGIVRKEALESMIYGSSDTNTISPSFALTVPSQIIPYREPKSEEKPLRNWPIITQIFNKSNFEICKNYFKSSVADEKEDEEAEEQSGKIDVEDVTIDISQGIKYHNSPKLTTLLREDEPTQIKMAVAEAVDEVAEVNHSVDLETTSNSNHIVSGNKDSIVSKLSKNSEDPLKPPNYVVSNDQVGALSSFTRSGQNSPTKLFASTTSIQKGYTDEESEKEMTSKTFYNDAWKISHPRYSLTDSLVNMRLLSSSTKTYESIVIPSNQEDEVDDVAKVGELDKNDIEKKNVLESYKDESKAVKKFYIIGIAIAGLIAFVLGIILFITISNSNTTSKIIARYSK